MFVCMHAECEQMPTVGGCGEREMERREEEEKRRASPE